MTAGLSGPTGAAADWIAFGPFVLHIGQHVLTCGGEPVPLNARSFELLVALLERPGAVLSNTELLDRVWRDRTVGEVNLRVAITALRRSLAAAGTGVNYILNAVGRGYAFSGNVPLERWPPISPDAAASRPLRTGQGRVPLLLKPVIGRDQAVGRIAALLDQHRFVTIVGPAGIGKTTVAISTVSRAVPSLGEVRFIDFAPGRDAALVPARIAAALTPDRVGSDALPTIIDIVADRRMVLIFDNCEHVLDAAAEAATAILQGAPGLSILATGREPLRADGEVIYRLEALGFPAKDFDGSAQDALAFPAVQLLVERVQAVNPEFSLTGRYVTPAVEICRRLDGIALAIQLAAGRVATFGLFEVASRLDDRFRFLGQGTRTALPRHQTLDAAIGWSFELLGAKERIVCERLAVFSGEFTLDAATEVAGWEPVAAQDVAVILANLVEKSLIIFLEDQARPRYVFLETIRLYCRRILLGMP